MKKYILPILLIGVLVGCEQSGNVGVTNYTSGVNLIKVDSCEYVFYRPSLNDGGAAIVHSGNCHNPNHFQNK